MTKRILGALFFALALAGPASAIEAVGGAGGDQTELPHLFGPQDPVNGAKNPDSGPERAEFTCRGAIFPSGDTDICIVRLPGGPGGTIYTFSLANYTRGFDPVMVISGAGRRFVVDRNGRSAGEVFRLRATGTVSARVTIRAFRGNSVGRYLLRVTP